MATMGSVGIDVERREIFGREGRAATSIILGKRMSGLSMPYSRMAWS